MHAEDVHRADANRRCKKKKKNSKLHHLQIQQKKSKRDYHRLKRLAKRSIEQDLRTRIYFLRKEKGTMQQTWVRRKPSGDKSNKRPLGKRWVWPNTMQRIQENIFFRVVPALSGICSRIRNFATNFSSINCIMSSSSECSSGRNVGSNSRQAGYGLSKMDTMTGPRSSQD